MFVFMFYQTKFISTCLLKSLQSAAINQTFNFTSHPLCKSLPGPQEVINPELSEASEQVTSEPTEPATSESTEPDMLDIN